MNGIASAALVVFAKEPRPGQVKTRMCPPLQPAEAAALYSCMLDDALEVSAGAAASLGAQAVLAVHPPDSGAEMAERAPLRFRVIAQRGRDLGARMAATFAELAAGGFEKIVLRGSDCPMLTLGSLRALFEGLERADLVVCPDGAGGYSAIGLRAPSPGLFDHPMSTDRVLHETLANASAAGLVSLQLEPVPDIDRARDLDALRRASSAPGGRDIGSDTIACARTLAYLRNHNWFA